MSWNEISKWMANFQLRKYFIETHHALHVYIIPSLNYVNTLCIWIKEKNAKWCIRQHSICSFAHKIWWELILLHSLFCSCWMHLCCANRQVDAEILFNGIVHVHVHTGAHSNWSVLNSWKFKQLKKKWQMFQVQFC
jgi:hypothetical protein